jgi:hypothetical protein
MTASLQRRVRALVDRTSQISNSFGRRAAFHDLQHRLVNRIASTTVLRGMTAVTQDVEPAMFDAGDLTARFATQAELLAVAAHPELGAEAPPAFVREAMARGDRCFALFDRDALVSFGWYSMHPTRLDDEMMLHFDPSWVYMYKGYTLHAYRGRRLHGIGMSLALRAYTEEGARGLISYVNSTNFQSLRSTERMGYRPFGDIYLMKLFGRTRAWATPGCAPYRFRAERESV